MATESCSKASEDSMPPPSSAAKQRRKRKWDQPAESFISAAGLAAAPGAVPLSLGDGLVGTSLGCGLPPGPVPAACAAATAAAAIVQKLNQPKTPVELIAREIVINDADPTIRYRLTKRQTQEEIQKTTGAVVITRGKYRPPSALPDNEKPLYLHISSGAHLKDTTERIKAVDRAASMIEGILKQGQNSQSGPATSCGMLNTGGLVKQPLSTRVFLGFVPDVSLNIAERIRGPNDKYISHIMNVTGATVVLKGRGMENSESMVTEETQQPLHLYLSSNNARNLEDARILAENLLDTICVECGASRISSCRTYNAVPPPQQLLAGVHSSANEHKTNEISAAGSTCLTISSSSDKSCTPAPVISASANVYTPRTALKPEDVPVQSQPNSYPHASVNVGTNYSGYGGIYPQATPLQQVAQALRHAPATSPCIVPVHALVANSSQEIDLSRKTNLKSSTETERRPQRRKFQESTVVSSGLSSTHQNLHQEPEFLMPSVSSSDLGMRQLSSMPPPKQMNQPVADGMPPPPPSKMHTPPPRDMPPPPPKFTASQPPPNSKGYGSAPKEHTVNSLSGPLMQLMEYGDEDDDGVDEDDEELSGDKSETARVTTAKPFWAV